MNKTIPPTSQPPATPHEAKSPRTRVMLMSAGIAALAVILAGVGGAYVVPKLMHQAQIAEYQSYIEATNQARAAENKAVLEAAALTELVPVRERAAALFATSVAGLGATAAPVFTAETAAELKSASEALAKSTPSVDDQAGTALQTAFEAEVKADAERVTAATTKLNERQTVKLAAATDDAARKKIGAETAEQLQAIEAERMSVHALDLNSADVIGLLELSQSPKTVKAAPSSKVNGELVATALSVRDDAVKAQQTAERKVSVLQQRVDETTANVEATVTALKRAAAEAPAQAAAVVAAAPRSGTIQQAALTTAVEAGNISVVAASTPSELLALVKGYQAAALAVTNYHAAVLAEEAAALAAASAAANGGPSDSSGGGWSDDGSWDGGSGGSWNGGGSSGGGGGGGSNSGGGGSTGGGGTSGGGGSSGGGGTPASWFEENCQWGYNWSSANGGTGYCYPNPNGDDDW